MHGVERNLLAAADDGVRGGEGFQARVEGKGACEVDDEGINAARGVRPAGGSEASAGFASGRTTPAIASLAA